MQFQELYFEFDEKRSSNLDFLVVNGRQKQLVIVNMDSSQDGMVGLQRTVNEEESSGFAPSFIGMKSESPTFTLTIACLDAETYEPYALTQDQMFKVNRWLFQDEYKPFKVYNTYYDSTRDTGANAWRDMIYYVVFLSGTRYNISNGRGYYSFEIRLDSPCAYSNIIQHTCLSTTTNTVEVENKSNVGTYAYPDVEIILNSGTSVKIENTTTGEVMEFTKLPTNAHLYCYNEGFKYIVDLNNPDTNPRLNFNKVWLRYVYGVNTIKVTGDCTVNLLHQNKIAIQ